MKKNPVLVNFGSRVREKRKESGLSQEELADLAGVHRTYIGMVERGEKNVSLLNIHKIASAMNIDIKELF
ncbi:MAG: helix-turn-helix transcriptional regulator [Pseudomonadaceae bacterium]|nr:helix-turn-helix transcriptional regulator [Pseudomonadaceae bacterium]